MMNAYEKAQLMLKTYGKKCAKNIVTEIVYVLNEILMSQPDSQGYVLGDIIFYGEVLNELNDL